MKQKGLIFLLLPLFFSFSSCGNNTKYEMKDYILESEYKSDYKILQLTDIHLSNKDDQDEHFKFMDLTIKDADPNMIIVTGDLFTYADKQTARRLFSFFDSYNIPWTVTFGNHDEQTYFSVDWLTGILGSKEYKNCLFKNIPDDNVYGNAKFAINLTKDNKVFEQLIILDSNRYYFGFDDIGYDYIKDNQIKWYEDLVNYTTSQNGKVTDSLMFFHIPLPEYDDAWNSYKEGKSTLITGNKLEKSCPSNFNSGLFSKIKELNSTKGVFVGHDHINDFIINYEGVYLGYGIHSTNRIYYDKSMLGGRNIIIHDDHSLTFENINHPYDEVK